MFLPAVIGDFVWDDLDADGVQDVGETGIDNVSVELFDIADVSQGTTTTNAAGAYSFSGLTPGDYYVVFTLPAGYLFSPQDAGGDDNLDSDANTATGRTANYTIASGDTETSVDAAMYLNATISDFVWDDLDADGIQDAGEPGLNGVTVELFNGAAVSLGTTTTAAGGAYSFTGLTPGVYFVGFTLPAGYQFSALDQGADDALDSDADTISGQTTTYTLTSGETETSVDAGMFTTGSIGDFVWEDLDGDGLQDAGEPGIDGVTVDLLDFGGAVINTTTTAGGGAYSFAGLAPAQYRIRFTTPLGYNFTTQFVGLDDTIDSDASQITGETALVTIVSGETNNRLDVGMYLPATIGDFVWIDYNGDGLQAEAGLPGVTVELLDSAGTVLQTTTTGATGAYSFISLAPQQYRIRFVPLGAYRITTQDAGVDDTQDSDADPATGETGLYTLSSGETNNTVDAGMWEPACIGNYVWVDEDGDGEQDSDEIGVNNVTLELLDSSLNPVITTGLGTFVTTTTGPAPGTGEPGFYEFCGLAPGSYAVRVTLPTGFEFTDRDNVSDDGMDSDVDTATGITSLVTVNGGDVILTIDAGVVDRAPPPCGECNTEVVTSPVRLSWNGFLEQTNILSIQNTCTSFENVDISLFDIDGNMVHFEQRMVFPKVQQDIILNDLPGFSANSYGQVEVAFPNAGCIDGFLYYFRLEPGTDPVTPQVEFAMVLPFKDAQTGTTYTTYNTFQPSGNALEAANLVTNWLQITNLENTAQSFTKNIYDLVGNLVESETISIPPMGRRDLQGGHVNPGPNNVGTVEIIPGNATARYMGQMFRYSGNAPSGQPISAFDFGMAFHARAGSVDCETINVSPGGGAENWLVVANTDSALNTVTVELEDIYGTPLGAPLSFNLQPFAQQNVSMNQHITSGASAVAKICTQSGATFITESLFYFRDQDSFSIESAYATQGSDGNCGAAQAGYNTFWGQTNWLRLTTTGICQVDVDIRVYDLGGNLIIAWPQWIAPGSGIDINLQDAPFNLPPNTYGLVEVTPFPHTPGAVKAEVVKVRANSNGTVDFATGMPVK